jgi:DNA-binding protein HU-beta
MNKAKMIDAVASEANLTKADAKRAIDAGIRAITSALTKGDHVIIRGVRRLYVMKRNERSGRNPQTGKPITIPSKRVVKFRALCPYAEIIQHEVKKSI